MCKYLGELPNHSRPVNTRDQTREATESIKMYMKMGLLPRGRTFKPYKNKAVSEQQNIMSKFICIHGPGCYRRAEKNRRQSRQKNKKQQKKTERTDSPLQTPTATPTQRCPSAPAQKQTRRARLLPQPKHTHRAAPHKPINITTHTHGRDT